MNPKRNELKHKQFTTKISNHTYNKRSKYMGTSSRYYRTSTDTFKISSEIVTTTSTEVVVWEEI